MESTETIKLADRYMLCWNAGQENILDELASKDIEVEYTHFGKTYKGIDEVKSMLKFTHSYFPDMKINIVKHISNAKSVTVMWSYTGTHKHGNLFGSEPKGKKVQVQGFTILEIENGKVVRESGVVDNLSLLMQLGVLENKGN
jgi:steroid delta-isomerase-like uncharacterized protein